MINNNQTLIIADVHLAPNDDEKTQFFINFCQNQATKAHKLFILGDLFNTWLGDDLSIKEYKKVIITLKELAKTTQILIIVGNRDFLLGKDFEEQSGCKIITDPYLLENKYVLIHGDSLCVDDINYQHLKKILRHPVTKFIFSKLTHNTRLKLSGQLRKKSITAKRYKPVKIMDINENAANKLMEKYPNADLIHGHTHRQGVHKGKKFNRYVLGDWEKNKGNAIKIENSLTFIDL